MRRQHEEERGTNWTALIGAWVGVATLLALACGALFWAMDANQRVLVYKIDQSLDEVKDLKKRVKVLEEER